MKPRKKTKPRQPRRPPIPAPRIIPFKHHDTMADEIVESMWDEIDEECSLLDRDFDDQGAPF